MNDLGGTLIRACPGWMRLLRYRPQTATTAVITGGHRQGWRTSTRCAAPRPGSRSYLIDLRPRTLELTVPVEHGPVRLTLVIVWWITDPLLVFLHPQDLRDALCRFVTIAVHQVLDDADAGDDLLAVRHRVATVLRRTRGTGIRGMYWYALNVRAHLR